MTYVKLTQNGFVHIRSDDKTVCGRIISRHDWMTIETLDPNQHALCHKCSKQRRDTPPTIREAFV